MSLQVLLYDIGNAEYSLDHLLEDIVESIKETDAKIIELQKLKKELKEKATNVYNQRKLVIAFHENIQQYITNKQDYFAEHLEIYEDEKTETLKPEWYRYNCVEKEWPEFFENEYIIKNPDNFDPEVVEEVKQEILEAEIKTKETSEQKQVIIEEDTKISEKSTEQIENAIPEELPKIEIKIPNKQPVDFVYFHEKSGAHKVFELVALNEVLSFGDILERVSAKYDWITKKQIDNALVALVKNKIFEKLEYNKYKKVYIGEKLPSTKFNIMKEIRRVISTFTGAFKPIDVLNGLTHFETSTKANKMREELRYQVKQGKLLCHREKSGTVFYTPVGHSFPNVIKFPQAA